ncbi:MAG: ThiF family adenylyltransferase [Acidobacteria bacterium]|nr:ThiF family adenylyltransferase [Acidobacteriota bacterium]
MSPVRISPSPDLQRLRDEGYAISLRQSHLVMDDVPYVNAAGIVRHGTLVSTLELNNDQTVKPSQHVVYFAGEHPCDRTGAELARIKHSSQRQNLSEGIVVDHSFSSRPDAGYTDYYDKMTTYANILAGPAASIDPTVTAKTFRVVADDEEELFLYMDTASARAGIAALAPRLAVPKLAIIGLGGTGSYILDFVAKTRPKEIHLFDGDRFLQHNAFRAPGAPSRDDLDRRENKAAYNATKYGAMRRHIIAHPYHVDSTNVSELAGMSFVFLCIDKSEPKRPIIEFLEAQGVPFIDVGMGINLVDDKLQGQVRVTTSTDAKRDHVRRRVSLSDADDADAYHQNIQIAELNALNASLAVIRWKKNCGYYHDLEHEHDTTYAIDGNHLVNEERP